MQVNKCDYNYKSKQKQDKLISILVRPLAGDLKSRTSQFSPTYMQSRHFHADQLSRDKRDLGLPSVMYYYTYSNPETSQEACRLTDTFCSYDYQCCAGKCRCVRWSSIGTPSCYKKCL